MANKLGLLIVIKGDVPKKLNVEQLIDNCVQLGREHPDVMTVTAASLGYSGVDEEMVRYRLEITLREPFGNVGSFSLWKIISEIREHRETTIDIQAITIIGGKNG